MTFNTQHCVNFITREIDYKIMAETILRFSPDFVVLNEMRDKGETEGYEPQTDILADLCNMPYRYFAKAIDVCKETSPYGNAIISKIPILSAETVHIPDFPPEERQGQRWYEHRCFLKARFDGNLTVLGVHVGLNPEEKKLAIETLLSHITDKKCLLMGDFNMSPQNEELLPIKELMKDAADLFTEPLLSCPSDTPKRKIDYIFASQDAEFVSADIPNVIASDHRPHIAELFFKE